MADRRRATAALAALLVSALLTAGTPGAGADPGADAYPPLPVTALLPSLPGVLGGYRPSAAAQCPRGEVACVDAVVGEMRRRLEPLLAACDHHAAFALTYLRVTEAYRRAVGRPGFFHDPPFVNHHAVVFAEVYFDAEDAWRRGEVEAVPEAWRIAFRAAEDSSVSAVGNLLLGLSAHVNHDLPFVLAAIGLRRPDGGSRKPDHDQVNAILRQVTGPVLTEVAERLDPAANATRIDGTQLDEDTLFQLLAVWREEAWRNAELLVAAPNAAARALLVQTIGSAAAVKGQSLLTATAYRPPLRARSARDAWCRTHG